MKRFVIPIFMAFLLLLLPVLAQAHPGRTDSNGGHYCRTNCAKWGLENGEYHYHNGGGSTTTKPATTPKPTAKPTQKPATKKIEPTTTPTPA